MSSKSFYREQCECGAAIRLAGPFQEEIRRHWDLLHQGPGHEQRITAPEAEAVRNELRRQGRLAAGKKR